MGDQHLMSFVGSHSRGSSQGLRRHEREKKRDLDHMHKEQAIRLDSREGFWQGYRSTSYIPKQVIPKGRAQEQEHLHKQVKKLELEVWGRCRRRNRDESPDDFDNTGESRREPSH
nr:hypothetical protein CFP56_65270 [Quercus suber]